MSVTFHTDSGGVTICVMLERRSRSTNDMLSAYYLVCQGSRHREPSQEASLFFITSFCTPFYLHFPISSLTLTNDHLRMPPSHRDLHLISFPIPHCLNRQILPIYVTCSHRLQASLFYSPDLLSPIVEMWYYIMLYELYCNQQFIDTYRTTCGEQKCKRIYRWQHYGCADHTD